MNYHPTEERWNTITHAIGGILSIIGSAAMIYYTAKDGTYLDIICAGIYGASLILLYFASTAYHGIKDRKWKRIFRTVDYLCIYLLIAGTYTPVVVLGIGGYWGWTLFFLIWGMVLMGFIFRFSSFKESERLSLALYVLMGWLIIVAIHPILERFPLEALAYFAVGGLLYTSGIYFYAVERIKYNHAIWHVFVLVASILHFFGIFFYVIP